jgi:hypothetical protein
MVCVLSCARREGKAVMALMMIRRIRGTIAGYNIVTVGGGGSNTNGMVDFVLSASAKQLPQANSVNPRTKQGWLVTDQQAMPRAVIPSKVGLLEEGRGRSRERERESFQKD